ncbi:FHA domain protein [Bacteriovorax sp. BSW11_IV]|uniref:FHA domain-containing protein n=1 Tax=Bacteriovorax sp. BSW11_IV TaxID=1353529 RepID=UPI000389E067|nr:FHA domain-containing protein [Bacteriovorax sp. BSW11_IV]EQC47059.1 FHA domain protein [Bacteriovorax sp. BSW11_IV]
MITIKVIQGPDENKITQFQFEFDSITIGSKKRCDIYLKDVEIGKLVLELEVAPNGVIIKNNNSDFFYYVNGKKISGSKLLKNGDHFKIGATQMILESFQKSWSQEREDLDEYLRGVYSKEPNFKRLYEILEREIIIATEGTNAKE